MAFLKNAGESDMKTRIFLLLAILSLLLSGCKGSKAPDVIPQRPVETSAELAEQARKKLRAIEAKGPFSLTLTEGEVTSLLISYIEEELRESPLREPAIWFEDGQIIARGKIVNVVPTTLEFVIVLSPYVENGLPQIKFDYVQVSGWKLPGIVLRFISRSANETLAEAKLKVYVEEIKVDQGSITVSGRFTD